ncbi:hypothetical protein PR08_gp49 [Idiomarinaceae phage Phi1M2-2]|uniref:hypothetical protein n=1 Tax=Idiomarinaceae phage Phi1M2-2 TaxID=1527515 RepID=UPI0004F69C5D|nr:hypothetical protein PR08_gp49 [Idiomarinaceae phage Phi1M2-2]AIM40806.1 hypothetical protein M22_049 [Idiomarinaceae phage Phi1M2-2]
MSNQDFHAARHNRDVELCDFIHHLMVKYGFSPEDEHKAWELIGDEDGYYKSEEG